MVSQLPRLCWLLAFVLLLVAAGLRWVIAPGFGLLSPSYGSELVYTATLWTRETPTSEIVTTHSTVSRRDQVLLSNGHALIEADARWQDASGKVIFETQDIYGVDRRTRANIPGYGTADREGQYLFPPHIQTRDYVLWDSNYGGPVTVVYDRQEKFRGLDVAVFRSAANGIDESAGYATTPGVPAVYKAMTSGSGTLLIEPVSGVVVDHQDEGITYFVERSTGQRVGEPLNKWTQRYTPSTIDAQVQRAKAARTQILMFETWLPLVCVAAALLALAGGYWIGRASK
ncbi:MAG TPA: porin PorA family protein [Bauldia sp.]|nr:porin PorA family protein [Bauldia sp.]